MKIYYFLGVLILMVVLNSATEGFKNKMFMFADNKVSTNCPKSVYSSDTGYVCITDDQYKFLGTRGGNSTIPSEF
jgi:hypothetical protein